MKKNIDSKQEKMQGSTDPLKKRVERDKDNIKYPIIQTTQDKRTRPNINISFNIISNNYINKQDVPCKEVQIKTLSETFGFKNAQKQSNSGKQTTNSVRFKQIKDFQKKQLQKFEKKQDSILKHRKIRSSLQQQKSNNQQRDDVVKNAKKHKRTPCSMDLPILQHQHKILSKKGLNADKRCKNKKVVTNKKIVSQGKPLKSQKLNKQQKPYQTQLNVKTLNTNFNQFYTQALNGSTNNRKNSKQKCTLYKKKAKPRAGLQQYMSEYRSGKINSQQFKKKLLKYVQSQNELSNHSLKQIYASKDQNIKRTLINKFQNSDSSKQIKVINIGKKSIIETFIELKQFQTQLAQSDRSYSVLSKNGLGQQSIEKYGKPSLRRQQLEKSAQQTFLNKNMKLKTSNSVKQIAKNIEQQRKQIQMSSQVEQTCKQHNFSYLDKMACKIQKAWKKYKTNKIIKKAFNFKKKDININFFQRNTAINQKNIPIIYFDSYKEYKRTNQENLQNSFHQKSKRFEIMSMIKNCLQVDSQMQKESCLEKIMKQIEKTGSKLLSIQSHDENLNRFKMMKEPHIIQNNRCLEQSEKSKNSKHSNQSTQGRTINIQPILLQSSQQSKIPCPKIVSNVMLQVQNQFEKLLYDQHMQEEDTKLKKFDKKKDHNRYQAIDSQVMQFSSFDLPIFQQKLAIYKRKLKQSFQKQALDIATKQTSHKKQKFRQFKIKYQSQIKKIEQIHRRLSKNYKKIKKIVQNQIKTQTLLCLNEKCEVGKNKQSKLKQLQNCYSQEYLATRFPIRKAYQITAILASPEKKNKNKQHLKAQQQQNYQSQSQYEEAKLKNQTYEKRYNKNSLNAASFEQEEEECSNIESFINMNFEQISQYYSDEQSQSVQSSDKKFKMKFQNLKHQIQLDQDYEYSAEMPKASQIKLLNSKKRPKSIKDGLQRYISRQEKENIFEFLFLDLCLQMFLDLPKGSMIISSIDSYMKDMADTAKAQSIPKGVKTNLHSIRQYLQKLFNFVISNYKNDLKRLQSSIGPTALQMLRYMHDYEQYDDPEADQESITLVLPIQIFQHFQKTFGGQLCDIPKCFQNKQKQQSRRAFLKSVSYVHHKAIFDCLNQFLDYERSYGIWGIPFPWKPQVFQTKFSLEQQKNKLRGCMDRILRIGAYLTGILVDKQDSILKNHYINEEYLRQIREDRLAKMLSSDLLQNQDRWTFYDDQETQVLIEVSSFVFRQIIREFSQQLKTYCQ